MQDDVRSAAIYKAVGQEVAKRRNALTPRVTQAQLSELTRGRLSRSAIANIESGRQRVAVHHVYDLADAMNCEPSDLLPPNQKIFALPASLVASVESDPEASEFTRRVLGRNDLSGIRPRRKKKG